MPSFDAIRQRFAQRLQRASLDNEKHAWTGRLLPNGTVDTSVNVIGQPNKIYIRFFPGDRGISVAWNMGRVALVKDVPIRVRLDDTGSWEVVGLDANIASAQYGSAAPAMAQIVIPPELNQQPTLIANVTDIKATPLTGMVWQVWKGFIEARYFAGSSIAVATLPTAGNELINYVGINPTSFELSVVNSASATIGTYSIADVDGSALGANVAPLAYAIVKYGVSSLQECAWGDLRGLIGALGSSADYGFPFHVTSDITIKTNMSVVVQGIMETDAGVSLVNNGRLTIL